MSKAINRLNKILDAISNFKSVPFEFDYQIRYAMKANSNINISAGEQIYIDTAIAASKKIAIK